MNKIKAIMKMNKFGMLEECKEAEVATIMQHTSTTQHPRYWSAIISAMSNQPPKVQHLYAIPNTNLGITEIIDLS